MTSTTSELSPQQSELAPARDAAGTAIAVGLVFSALFGFTTVLTILFVGESVRGGPTPHDTKLMFGGFWALTCFLGTLFAVACIRYLRAPREQ